MSTYKRLPVRFTHGEGVWLIDDKGRRYLDAVSGVAVCSLGHAHPELAADLCAQAQKLLHTSNLYEIPQQDLLAERLVHHSGFERVFFCNSGAEANEAALKIARLYGHSRGIARPEIVVAENSFHGRTLATLSATGNRRVQAGFEPLVQGFVRVAYNDINALKTVAGNRRDVVAVMLEPVQGEGGVNVPNADYLDSVRAICDAQGWLLMLDEIQTGMCRTGRWFAHQHGIGLPDVMTLAKALGNGVPIGACLARGPAAELMTPGSHGSTFGGNPLACTAGLTVTRIMEREGLVERAALLGKRLLTGLQERLGAVAAVRSVRGLGLLVGIELDKACPELPMKGLEKGILVNVTAGNVVRLLPPLIMSDGELELLTTRVSELIQDFSATTPPFASESGL